MPIFLILVCMGVGAHLQNQRNQKVAVYTDPGMPSTVRNEVLRAIMQDNDPQCLYDFAASIDHLFPIAAYELRCRAWVLSGRTGKFPDVPQLNNAPASRN